MAAETPTPLPSSPPPPPPSTAAAQYWCYHCDKRVSVETQSGQPDEVMCAECKFGFVELIAITTSSSSSSIPSPPPSHNIGFSDEFTFGNQFIQVLQLLAQSAHDDDAPPPPPPPPPRPLNPEDPSPADDSDFLRIEIDGWDEDDANNEDDDDDEDEDEGANSNYVQSLNGNDDDDDDDDEEEEEEEEEEDDARSVEIEGHTDEDEEEREEDIRRRRRDVLRLRLEDWARSEGRNRILDWAEILMGLEDNSIEFRFEMPETNDRYVGNPLDYVDAAEYEAVLQNLADAEGRRGAPPASKTAVEGLKVVEIKTMEETFVCAICKDGVNVGDFMKEMPCGHGYHGDCIVPWLAARNSCPVCRFELPTDDVEYEAERKKLPGSSSGSSGGNSV